MRLRIETRHRLLVVATGDDAREVDEPDDELHDAVVGTGSSADLGPSIDDAGGADVRGRRRRAGFTAEVSSE